MSHFGDHIIIDCYGCVYETLKSESLIRNCINDIVKACNMELMNVPVVYRAKPISERDKGGYTAFAVITESHVSMHTFPFRGYNSIDVYTCRNDLDHNKVLKVVDKCFAPDNKDVSIVKRGIQFPNEDVI